MASAVHSGERKEKQSMTMTITDVPMLRRIEEALSRTGRKKRARTSSADASTRALRESGVSEKDITILVEGAAREADYVAQMDSPARVRRPDLPDAVAHALRVFQETTGDGQDGAGQLSMPPNMTGWRSEGDSTAVYSHAQHGRLKLGAGRWTRHHATTGRILASGTTQESLANHLRGLVGDTGNSGAADANAESLTDVLNRLRGITPVPAGTHARLLEALTRPAHAAPTSSGQSLHERLRKAVVRP
jgi:hypothetical protein